MRIKAGDLWTENNLVFTNETGGYLSYRTVYDCFKRIMVKIGSPATRIHDLRHTYATLAIKSGDDIKTVQENLGHATAAFTLGRVRPCHRPNAEGQRGADGAGDPQGVGRLNFFAAQ